MSSFGLEHSRDEFGIRSHGVVERGSGHRSKFYALPQSTAQQYIRLRPADFRSNPFPLQQYTRQEVIGPYSREGSKIWFGKQFYDSEGMRGVGAFGYFDTLKRRYTLFSPRAVASCEVSALFVEPEAVWVALDRFVESAEKVPVGLVRWDRVTHQTKWFSIRYPIRRIERKGTVLQLVTSQGIQALPETIH